MNLTYCTNIHPGEGWADVRRNLDDHVLGVKKAVSPTRRFPLGLRLSNRATLEVDTAEAERFLDWCEQQGCFVLTLNGFPHGQFHGTGVKANVYLPDWRDAARAGYTRRLADLLAGWLPSGVAGSISTVPVAFERDFLDGDWPLVRRNIVAVLEHLDAIREARGSEIVLAFEPEPGCVLETTADVVETFERLSLPERLQSLAGVCFDCCHQAVEFEDPAASLQRLARAGIRLGKAQLSSALRARGDEIGRLAAFDEPTYLHQVVARGRDGSLLRYDDLPQFVDARPVAEECRVHFHVPIFADHLGACGTTRFFLEQALPLLAPSVPLEVETYSWGVLPPELRLGSVAESVARELRWVQERL